MEGRAFIVHILEVPTSIASTALLSIPSLSGDAIDLLAAGIDTSPFEAWWQDPRNQLGHLLFLLSYHGSDHHLDTSLESDERN